MYTRIHVIESTRIMTVQCALIIIIKEGWGGQKLLEAWSTGQLNWDRSNEKQGKQGTLESKHADRPLLIIVIQFL